MKAHHYSDAVIMLGDKPLCTAESVTVSPTPDAREALPPFHATFRCTADVSALFDVVRLPPTQPRGYVTIPWGILGPLRLQGSVDLPSWQVTEAGTKGAFQMAENEMRRAVSMAVQRAIMKWHRRVAVIGEAQKDPTLRRMASKVHTRYRGERKRRKAMRRLLRAAGILGGGQ